MTDLWRRLKQRKLVQWALAYVAAAFALLQGVDIFAQRFAWPDAVERAVLIAACVGFFVTLLLAWYHGERGVQKVSGVELALLTLLLAIGGGLMWGFSGVPKALVVAPSPIATAAPKPVATLAPATASIPAKSIAVLPFENLSADKNNEYFASGMQDMILTKLAEVGELQVASRTSAAKYASHPDDVKHIARELGVANLLEGSVQKAGNQVLINVQLIDARTDRHLWAQSYQRTLDNIFGVEGEVAEQIASALKAHLTPLEASQLAKAGTHNTQALDDHLRARFYGQRFMRSGSTDDWTRSLAFLKQAVELDPNYAEAWASLALTYSRFPEYRQQQREAVQRALRLAPDNADAHRQMAFVLRQEGKPVQALAEARRAVELAPESMTMLAGLAYVQMNAGKLDEAIATYRKVLSIPSAQWAVIFAVRPMGLERRYAEARDLLRDYLVTQPDDLTAVREMVKIELAGWGNLAAARATLQVVATSSADSVRLAQVWFKVYWFARDYAQAVQVMQRTPSGLFQHEIQPRALYLGWAWQRLGQTAKAQAAFADARDEIRQRLKTMPNEADAHAALAQALSGLGDHAQAIREAQQAMSLKTSAMDAEQGPTYVAIAARVDAEAGDSDAAITKLRQLLDMPAGWDASVPLLSLDPAWDPLRNDPRFQALLKKYADPAPATASSEVKP